MNAGAVFRLPGLPLRAQRRPTTDAQPRVLFLTSGLGTGHSRAALAIERALESRHPGIRLQTVDFWSLLDGGVAEAIKRSYLRLVTDRPDLYQRLYQLDQHSWRDILERGQPLPPLLHELKSLIVPPDVVRPVSTARHWVDRVLYRQLAGILARADHAESPFGEFWQQAAIHRSWQLLARRLRRRIAESGPDVIVATQVNIAALAAHLRRSGGITAPLLGVVTDYGIHDFWLQRGIDTYFVADGSLAGRLAGATHRDVRASGIPLMPGFAYPPSARKARELLGLPAGRPVVLVLGGGLGLGIESVVRALARTLPDAERSPLLVVLAGRNRQIVRELEDDPAIHERLLLGHVRIQGWTEETVLFIRAADLVIGKPGGLTTAEVLACGRPLLSTCSLRGQESFNVAFLENNGVGQLLGEERLVRRVLDLLDDPPALERMQARAWDLGQRHGAERIANHVLRLATANLSGHAGSMYSA